MKLLQLLITTSFRKLNVSSVEAQRNLNLAASVSNLVYELILTKYWHDLNKIWSCIPISGNDKCLLLANNFTVRLIEIFYSVVVGLR